MINCQFEDEGKGSLRHVTVDSLIIKNNKILLVKRASELLHSGKYALPGGFLDRDETTEDGITREVKEETGYEVNSVTLFRLNSNPARKGEDRQNVDFVFIVGVGEKTGTSDEEVESLSWFDLDKLPDEENFAFDHFENIKLYKKYLQEQFPLPILN